MKIPILRLFLLRICQLYCYPAPSNSNVCIAPYTDGASRGNPGLAASGIHIVDETTSETVVDLGVALDIATNNVAEYQAALQAVAWLCAHKELLADDIQLSFRLDSRLVVSFDSFSGSGTLLVMDELVVGGSIKD